MLLTCTAAAHCSSHTCNGCSQTVIHVFITSGVDYYSGVLGNASAVHLHPVQSVLYAAARCHHKEIMYDHITATICDQLHWLPVKQWIDYKLYTFSAYNAVHYTTPVYLRDRCIAMSSISGRSGLWAAANGDFWSQYQVTPASDQLLIATCIVNIISLQHPVSCS